MKQENYDLLEKGILDLQDSLRTDLSGLHKFVTLRTSGEKRVLESILKSFRMDIEMLRMMIKLIEKDFLT